MQWRLLFLILGIFLVGIILLKTMVIYAKIIGALFVFLAAFLFIRSGKERKRHRGSR